MEVERSQTYSSRPHTLCPCPKSWTCIRMDVFFYIYYYLFSIVNWNIQKKEYMEYMSERHDPHLIFWFNDECLLLWYLRPIFTTFRANKSKAKFNCVWSASHWFFLHVNVITCKSPLKLNCVFYVYMYNISFVAIECSQKKS